MALRQLEHRGKLRQASEIANNVILTCMRVVHIFFYHPFSLSIFLLYYSFKNPRDKSTYIQIKVCAGGALLYIFAENYNIITILRKFHDLKMKSAPPKIHSCISPCTNLGLNIMSRQKTKDQPGRDFGRK